LDRSNKSKIMAAILQVAKQEPTHALILAYDLRGMSYAEIGLKLGCPPVEAAHRLEVAHGYLKRYIYFGRE